MKILLWTIAILMAVPAWGQQIDVGILQAKLNRIYLSAGSEAGIKPGAPFLLSCTGQDTLTGVIEYAGPGVSYSEPMPSLEDYIVDAACMARVTVAAVDSTATITVGSDLPLAMYDLEHEPLFVRIGDTMEMNLVDSAAVSGSGVTLYIRPDIRFSDGTPLNAEVVRHFLDDLRANSQSYLTRYFFAKILPSDSGGIEATGGYALRLNFYRPFPRVCFFLSRPEFAVYNKSGRGTGRLMEASDTRRSAEVLTFVPNKYYRGATSAFSSLTIRHYDQQNRMTFAFENKELDAVIGFGYNNDIAGSYETKALYPDVVAMIAGIGRELFTNGLFSTSLYYSFNPSLTHLYFQYGDVAVVNRWLAESADGSDNKRYYPYDILKGKTLLSSIDQTIDSALMVYDNPILYHTIDFIADVAAREGMTATTRRYVPGVPFDIRAASLPASDDIMPFALFAAVLELNDQNSMLPPGRQYSRPGWDDIDRGSRLYEKKNRTTFFSRAEDVLFEDYGFFPLYRPYVYAVPSPGVSGFDFDFYGFPVLDDIKKRDIQPDEASGGSNR